MGNSPVPPSWSHGHLRWRPLPPEAPAPASFLRKLGSPWQRGCPWGGPLGSVPRSSADIRDSAPPAGTCASPGRRERLRGGVREEGEGEARQNLGPGRPGRPRRSCSLQQVRRTRARPVAEPPPPPPAQVGRGDPSRRPGAAGCGGRLPPALLPSPVALGRRRLFRGAAEGHWLLLASAPPRGQLLRLAGSPSRAALSRRGRRLPLLGPGPGSRPPRTVLAPAGVAPLSSCRPAAS